ncbi:zinc/iron-chelating domain-containing protein [Geopsychrobacter electrodiphilus]|uniref:zinc/iron-chelating domain-containing protein n=1 Tax=Geopsychrobacter electrodiphilus TaxID=225196 RepID=UPI000379CCCC|nr:zinc/iron-chelating domain-containing protein [Geopsychrobacter electrodiphilus]
MPKTILDQYQTLLQSLDHWFSDCITVAGDQITCHKGCSSCCRGLFEISLLDARLLQQGFDRLDAATRELILVKARTRVTELQTAWPGFQPPYILNRLPHDNWQEMPEDDPTPCPLLSGAGHCLIYSHRPMCCRLHGLPNIDLSGESFSDDYCTLNFSASDPLQIPELRFPFRVTFTREFDLLARFARVQFGTPELELDTFIPCALLIDFDSPD